MYQMNLLYHQLINPNVDEFLENIPQIGKILYLLPGISILRNYH